LVRAAALRACERLDEHRLVGPGRRAQRRVAAQLAAAQHPVREVRLAHHAASAPPPYGSTKLGSAGSATS
jgi:hypothetical protein